MTPRAVPCYSLRVVTEVGTPQRGRGISMGRMTQRRMRELTAPGRYGDGHGLYFYVGKNGARSWVQRIVINGRRRDIGLGAAAVITLSAARERAFRNRVEVAHGRDPFADRARSKRMPTFRQAAGRYFEAARDKWRSDKTRRNWVGQMELHAYPGIGDTRIDRITRADILSILTPIWSAKPDIARKVRSRLRAVVAWAVAHGYVETNIVDAVEGALPSMPAGRKHFRALAYADVPAALAAVDASRASRAVKLAFRFLVLTAARSGEVRGAKWDEIDLDARTWTVPANRMKAGREHRVPLSDAALAVLADARALADESGLVFPSARGKELSDMTLSKMLRTTGIDAVPHGFRTSFRTWASECTNVDFAVAEVSLAHNVGSAVERAYSRSDLLVKRARLMDAWAGFLTGQTAKVVEMRRVG